MLEGGREVLHLTAGAGDAPEPRSVRTAQVRSGRVRRQTGFWAGPSATHRPSGWHSRPGDTASLGPCAVSGLTHAWVFRGTSCEPGSGVGPGVAAGDGRTERDSARECWFSNRTPERWRARAMTRNT